MQKLESLRYVITKCTKYKDCVNDLMIKCLPIFLFFIYDISIIQANRDAGIREAECEKAAMDVKYNTDTKIEDNSRAFKLQKANFDKEVNTAVSN